jgi:diguanylate cyclase (GGDEF)-like protein
MSRLRKLDRKTQNRASSVASRSIFLIEDSVAVGLLLKSRIEAERSIDVEWYKTYAEAAQALAERRPVLAVTGFQLPDAPDGEILDLLAEKDVPTLLFAATLDRKIRERFTTLNLVDYFVKDTKDTVEQVVKTILRLTDETGPPILIVDDSRTARSSLVSLLRQQSYRLFEAASGEEALDLLAANPEIELVVTDYHMPDMNGHELTRRIRAQFAGDRVRVIGISTSSDPFLSASFLKAGASDFIYRPFIAEEVKYRIESNIETLDQIKRLRFLAERDPLTELYNRRAFFERAQRAIETMKARGQEGSVAILDIDHFKKVNDTYGHDTGDVVIKLVAKVIDELNGTGEVVTARFGGEEFVMLWTNLANDAVQAKCEQVREAIARLVIPAAEGTFSITVSIGAAIFRHAEGMDNNLNAADQMLYMAKKQGRNQVIYDAAFS